MEVDLEEASSDDGRASTYTRLELPKNVTFVEVQVVCLECFGNNKGSILWLEKKVDTYACDIVERFNGL